MKPNSLKSLALAAVVCACIAAPVVSSAQVYGGFSAPQRYDRNSDRNYDRRSSRDEVDQVAHDSKSFRAYFEHNFRLIAHPNHRWDPSGRFDHPEHMGRHGQMTLLDAIQNMDEDFERLRAEVDHRGPTRYSHELMAEIVDHMADVDARINRAADAYSYNDDRNWRYDRSELYDRWQELRSEINGLARRFNGRGR